MERKASVSFHLSVLALLVVLSVLCLPSCNTQREELATVAGQLLLVVKHSARGDSVSRVCGGGEGEVELVRECAPGSSVFVSPDGENISCTRDSVLQQG